MGRSHWGESAGVTGDGMWGIRKTGVKGTLSSEEDGVASDSEDREATSRGNNEFTFDLLSCPVNIQVEKPRRRLVMRVRG